MSERKVYLGDAVYAEVDDCGDLVLTTENGVMATNTIVLEQQVIKALIAFLHRAALIANAEGSK